MSVMMGFGPHNAGTTLTARRREAANELGIQAVTFRSERRYEQAFVTELAFAVYQQVTGCA